jgi:Protein of unknown function (DUF4197)
MFKKALLSATLLAFSTVIAFAQVDGLLNKAKKAVKDVQNGGVELSQDEIGAGLKEALDKGVGTAVDFLSAKDGYFASPYKILMPEEAQKVASRLKVVPGFANVEADLTERMNRAAEDAAQKAKPIFLAAIKSMTFQDALNILTGKPDAATRFLESSTYEKLYAEFKPVIQTALDKVNAREYWRSAVGTYNKLPMVTKTNPELDDHVTKMALVGMFKLIEQKEAVIRRDVSQRDSDLLRRVFARQDKK